MGDWTRKQGEFEVRKEHRIDGEVAIHGRWVGNQFVKIRDCLQCGCLFVGERESFCQRCDVEAERQEQKEREGTP